MKRDETYNNFLDFCISIDENPTIGKSGEELFKYALTEFFFKRESSEKGMITFFKNFKGPDFAKEITSLADIDIDELRSYVEGESAHDSLSGKIYLSKPYLKTFFPEHPQEFKSIPSSVQSEILSSIHSKNAIIIEAFLKMKEDIEADKNRNILTLIALILRNIHLKNGIALSKLSKRADLAIRDAFTNCDEIFKGSQQQMRELDDDSRIKTLIKAFFPIKAAKDFGEISSLYKSELKRYQKRSVRF